MSLAQCLNLVQYNEKVPYEKKNLYRFCDRMQAKLMLEAVMAVLCLKANYCCPYLDILDRISENELPISPDLSCHICSCIGTGNSVRHFIAQFVAGPVQWHRHE